MARPRKITKRVKIQIWADMPISAFGLLKDELIDRIKNHLLSENSELIYLAVDSENKD